jgi:hypothetical protein
VLVHVGVGVNARLVLEGVFIFGFGFLANNMKTAQEKETNKHWEKVFNLHLIWFRFSLTTN